ncbi:MAG: laminin G domain-containing protein [Verrucomicrobiales bacterium]|nr:laminin G domain-containing protein [Verrucomicrobiales bacterium]
MRSIFPVVILIGAWFAALEAAENDPPQTHIVVPSSYSLPKTGDIEGGIDDEEKRFSIVSKSAATVSIDLGSMPVEPGTNYLARVEVDATELHEAAGVSLMIRELPSEGVGPFKPYHRTSTNLRPLIPGTTSNRELNFTTRPESHALSVAIVVTELTGELRFSEFRLTPSGKPPTREEAMQQSSELMAEIRAAADSRKPLTRRPLVYSRSQMKYPLGKNYYHQWNDRPLLVDRKYRVPSIYPTPLPSYRRTLQEVVKYDIDGLAFFPETTRRIRMFEAHREAGFISTGLLPEFLATDDQAAIEAKLEILKLAINHPAVPRIDGKVLVTSYRGEGLSPERWRKLLDTLRREVGDQFLYLPALTNVAKLRQPFMRGEPITRAAVEKEQAVLRSYLDVCDGIYFNYPAAFRHPDHTFDEAFYRDIFIPVFKSVLSEPAYRSKYLGLSAYRSHMSPERSNSLHEDGTRTLRRSFEAAMEARPDVIVLPEWDEQNENTSIRPTVYGSRTTGRIIRYYMSRIKNKDPTPMPGDDLTIPNLILSSRKAVTLGERAVFELLNVPDSVESTTYRAKLKLEDLSGKTVHQFPEVVFETGKLGEHRFHLPTERHPQVTALVPVLSVRNFEGRDLEFNEGFHHTAVRATWNWDHLYVKQPLRDLLHPGTATLAWRDDHTLTAGVKSSEPLALIELLGDDDEVYTYDPQDEFFGRDPDKVRLLVEFRSINNQTVNGTLTLRGATAEWFSNGAPPVPDPGQAQTVQLIRPVSVHQRQIYLAIPNKDIASGELHIEFDKGSLVLPLREIVEKQMIARGFAGGIHLSVKTCHRQLDLPASMEVTEANFKVPVQPEIATGQFHLRLTSTSGKTWRSRPVVSPSPNPDRAQTLRVFSDERQEPVDLQIAASRIPSLRYHFTPRHGAVLLTEAGRPFWATLGGFSNSTTGRGTVNGLFSENYPAEIERSEPQWVEDGGTHCLEFDGHGTYLELPREALPWHGAFTLEFEVKPKTDRDQVLLVNGALGRRHGLRLDIQDGRLLASFWDAKWKTHSLHTRLRVPPETWTKIRVRRDFETITLNVGESSKSFPVTHPAGNTGFTVFGAGWKGNAFAGRLRGLVIDHNAL